MSLVSLENLTRFYTKLKEKMYLKTEVDTKLSSKSDTSHTHDDRYYTESEINTKLNGKANSSHTHSYNDLSNRPSIPSALSPYPVGSVYFSVNNTNPANYFGGSWVQIGTKLVISENVIGNGKALALTDSRRTGGLVMHHNPSRTAISPKAFGQSQYSWADDIAGEDRRAYGVPTKSQLGSNLSNSGLIVDTVTIYSWKRTA